MAAEMITVEDLEKFRIQLLNDLKAFIQQPRESEKKWLRSSDVRKMLGISHGTLQNFRIRRLLPYKKIGGIFFYKLDDVLVLLNAD